MTDATFGLSPRQCALAGEFAQEGHGMEEAVRMAREAGDLVKSGPAQRRGLPTTSAMRTALGYMRSQAEELHKMVLTVSGSGEGAEIYRDAARCIEAALSTHTPTSPVRDACVETGVLPQGVREPNATTIAALEELKNGGGEIVHSLAALAPGNPGAVEADAEIGMLREKLSDALAGGLPHFSDCAVYQAPAYEPGPCNCGVGISVDDNALDLVRKIREHNGWTQVLTDRAAVNLVKSFLATATVASPSPATQPQPDSKDMREALDNSQSLLAMFLLLGDDYAKGITFSDWENEELSKKVHDQIIENRAALTARVDAPAAVWRWRHSSSRTWEYGEQKPEGPSIHLFEVECFYAALPPDAGSSK